MGGQIFTFNLYGIVLFLLLGPGYCSTRYARSQFRDDKVLFVISKPQPFLICHPYFLFCHPGNCEPFQLSSRKAERSEVYPGSRSRSFYSWVPDTVRLATLAHSSGTTKFYLSSRNCKPFLICHPYFLFCHLENRHSSQFVIPEIASAIIRDPEADRFYSWVPDTVRLATLAHSSGTTGGKISSSESGTTLFIGLGRQKSFVNAKSCDAIHCLDTPSMH